MDRKQGRIHGHPSCVRVGRAKRDRQTKKDRQKEKIVNIPYRVLLLLILLTCSI